MDSRRQNQILIGAGVLCMIVAAVLLHTFKGEFGRDTVGVSSVPAMEETIDASQAKSITEPQRVTSTPSLPSEWIVHITGAVKKPGVYKVPCDSRVYTALEAAGGFSEKADPEAVNLAAKLADGVQIHFPAKGERQQNTSAAPPAVSQKLSAAPTQGTAAQPQNPVNINTATQKELETLKGIGTKMAKSIIEYRAVNGNFARIEDLMLVKGIGAKKFDALKGMVTVDR